jgi:hypothetical protein
MHINKHNPKTQEPGRKSLNVSPENPYENKGRTFDRYSKLDMSTKNIKPVEKLTIMDN